VSAQIERNAHPRASDRVYTAAIIGLGRIGSLLDDPWADRHLRDESWRVRPCTHAGQFAAHPRTRLVAGAELDRERRAAFEARWGVRAYADHREMLARERPDVVSICTRAADRFRPTMDAIAARPKAILLEKHLSATLAEADAVVLAGAAAQVPLVVNLTLRFAASVRALVDVIRGGAVGELRSVVCYPGPLLVHSGIHFFDLCRFLGAGEATRAFGRLDGDPDTADPPGSGYLEFSGGVRAYVDARGRAAHGYMEIHGTNGIARVGSDEDCTVTCWRVPDSADPARGYYQPIPEPVRWAPAGSEDGSIRRGRNINRWCVDEVVACADTGREPVASARDCLLAQEMAVAMHVSHRMGGRLVDLPLRDRDYHLNAI
jgi:predicted dehydrogenase